MFVFLIVVLIKILVVVSTIENLSITDESELERTTFAPMNLMSNELEKAVHSLQTAIHLLMPNKNLISSQELQLIKCLSNNEELSEEETNLCQEIFKNDQLNRKRTVNQTRQNHYNSLMEKFKNSIVNIKTRPRDNDEDNRSNLGQILSRTYRQNSSMTEFDTRTRDLLLEKNLLLANLTQTLRTLESIIDQETLLQPVDLISIIKNQKFSRKFLRFLDMIKTRSISAN